MLFKFVLLLVYLHKTSQMPPPISKNSGLKRVERVFDITSEDKLNIKLADAVGVIHLAVSYPEGVNCTLLKTEIEEPQRSCANLSFPLCTSRDVVRVQNITEDCSEREEYCQYSFRMEEITQQTVICQRPADVVCDSECSDPSCDETYCEKNSIVVCSSVHQTVAITEKKQKCGPDGELQTTKICFTYPDASWVCKEPRSDLDCDRESVRLVAHEVASPKVDCKEKELEALCLPANCKLKSNNTDCLTTDLPRQIRLEDQICEPCQDGRTKLRPVIVQEESCEGAEVREVCRDLTTKRDQWTKRCLLPSDMKQDMLEKVLLHIPSTKENEIPEDFGLGGGENKTEHLTESKIVRMRVPAARGQKHTRRILRRPAGEENIRTKVNFKFLLETSTSRPTTGVPYVYADPGFNDDKAGQNRNIFLPSRGATPNTTWRTSALPTAASTTARFAGRFSIRPTPAEKKPWKSPITNTRGSNRESQNRFPYIGWQNEKVSLETSSFTPSAFNRAKLFQSNSNINERNTISEFSINPRKNPHDKKKSEKMEGKSGNNDNVLENAVFADDKDYIKLHKKTELMNESLIDDTTTVPSIDVQSEMSDTDRQTKPITTTSKSFPISDPVTISNIESQISKAEDHNYENAKTDKSGEKFRPNNIFDVIDHMTATEAQDETVTATEVSTEEANQITTEEGIISEADTKEDSMCGDVRDKRELIRCKLVACFTDNQYCY